MSPTVLGRLFAGGGTILVVSGLCLVGLGSAYLVRGPGVPPADPFDGIIVEPEPEAADPDLVPADIFDQLTGGEDRRERAADVDEPADAPVAAPTSRPMADGAAVQAPAPAPDGDAAPSPRPGTPAVDRRAGPAPAPVGPGPSARSGRPMPPAAADRLPDRRPAPAPRPAALPSRQPPALPALRQMPSLPAPGRERPAPVGGLRIPRSGLLPGLSAGDVILGRCGAGGPESRAVIRRALEAARDSGVPACFDVIQDGERVDGVAVRVPAGGGL